MTTETLNFPVFHSDQGVGTDVVQFSGTQPAVDLTKAKDFDLTQAAGGGDMAAF